MKFETDEEFQFAVREFRKQFPWIDEMMAGIFLRTPEEKLDEIWDKVKHNKFVPKKSKDLITIEDAFTLYENESDIPPPPSTLTPEQIAECQSRCPKGPPMVLDNTWSDV